MPSDTLHHGEKSDGVAAQVFFWPGQTAVAQHLAQGLGAAEALPLDPTALAAVLQGGARAIVLWRGPEDALTPCLSGGLPVSAALDGWKDDARRLVALFRRHRRTMILAEAEALRRSGTEALTDRLGLPALPPLPEIAPPPALGLALAQLAVQQDDDLRQLVDDLVSSSLPAPELAPGAVLGQVVAETMAQVDHLTHLQDQLATATELGLQADKDRAELAAHADLVAEHLRQMEAALQAQVLTAEAEAAATAAATAEQMQTLEAQIGQQEQNLLALTAEALDLQARLDASQAEAAKASQRVAHLEDLQATQDKKYAAVLADAIAMTTRMAERDAEAQLLVAQVKLSQSDLAIQAGIAETAAAAAAERIAGLEQRLAQTDKRAAALSDEARSLAARLAGRDADVSLLSEQLTLVQGDLLARIGDLQSAAEAAALQADALQGQIAVQDLAAAEVQGQLAEALQRSAALSAAQSQAEADLTERDRANALLEQQVASARTDLNSQLEAAGQQIKTLEAQAKAVEQDKAAAEKALKSARSEATKAESALADERTKRGEALAEKTRLNAELTARSTELSLMSLQVGMLQDAMAQLVVTPGADPSALQANVLGSLPEDEPTPRHESWDRALAQALAAARNEAEQRARLEQDLAVLKAAVQARAQLEADVKVNNRLFGLMTQEANAALDELARLKGAKSLGIGLPQP